MLRYTSQSIEHTWTVILNRQKRVRGLEGPVKNGSIMRMAGQAITRLWYGSRERLDAAESWWIFSLRQLCKGVPREVAALGGCRTTRTYVKSPSMAFRTKDYTAHVTKVSSWTRPWRKSFCTGWVVYQVDNLSSKTAIAPRKSSYTGLTSLAGYGDDDLSDKLTRHLAASALPGCRKAKNAQTAPAWKACRSH